MKTLIGSALLLTMISVTALADSAVTAPTAANGDGIFRCEAGVVDQDNPPADGQGYVAHFSDNVTAPQSNQAKTVTLVEYKNVKVMLVLAHGAITVVTIGDGDAVRNDGSIGAQRQDFSSDMQFANLSLKAGKVLYAVSCAKIQ